jgi:hypothetical protein
MPPYSICHFHAPGISNNRNNTCFQNKKKEKKKNNPKTPVAIPNQLASNTDIHLIVPFKK